MRKILILLFAVMVLSGCVPQFRTNLTEVVAAEAAKIRRIEIGMTVREVESLMGADPIVFNYSYGAQYEEKQEARPVRIDKFQTKDGKRVSIYFYRSAIKNMNDGVCTDDETTAVVFVEGKVDALLPGEKSKEVIEVRFR